MQRITAILICSVCVPSLAALAASSSTGTISGGVVDDAGAPLANASVVYRSVPPPIKAANGRLVPGGPVVSSSVKTAADGMFTVNNLPPANYNLCAYGTRDIDLGSCEWIQGTTHLTLASGQTAQLSFHVGQGTLLTFHVQDPRQQIKSLEDLPTVAGHLPLTGANFGVGIWAGSRYVRAAMISANGATRQYQLTIPKTAVVRLHLDTRLAVVDDSGMSLQTRQPGTTVAAAGSSAVTVNLTVP
jgi:Carboxypeptidase regulatory-like domain